MVDNCERLDSGRELTADGARPSPSITGVPALLPQFLGDGELASLDWLDMALMTRTTSLSQPHDSANKARDLDVADNTDSYTWSRKYAEKNQNKKVIFQFCIKHSVKWKQAVFKKRPKLSTFST